VNWFSGISFQGGCQQIKGLPAVFVEECRSGGVEGLSAVFVAGWPADHPMAASFT